MGKKLFVGLALEWVKSYFFVRAQFLEFNNVRSSPQGISCGVPQGPGGLLPYVTLTGTCGPIGYGFQGVLS